jgi:glycine/D-amino acid oxidase-like deaminating enzyme
MSDPRVAVIGGGAVGATAARDLAVRGADVTLYERDEVGSGSTGRAAGICYDAFAEDVDARVAARALARFREFSGAGALDFRECPYVVLAREGDDENAAAIERSVERMRVHGREVHRLSPAELGERFPLRVDNVAVAAVAENAGWTDPGGYAVAMADLARAAGADVREDAPARFVDDAPGAGEARPVVIDTADDARREYDAVIVAAGAHTKRVLAAAGLAIPLKPYRVQALVSAGPYDGPTFFDASAGVYARPHPDGLLAGDGAEAVEVDPDAWDRAADDRFLEKTAGALRRRADHDLDVREAWAGLCTATPDGDPLVGPVAPGVYVAVGWHGHGFMRAPAIAEAVADQVLGSGGIPQFDPGRFDGDEEFEIVEGMTVDE